MHQTAPLPSWCDHPPISYMRSPRLLKFTFLLVTQLASGRIDLLTQIYLTLKPRHLTMALEMVTSPILPLGGCFCLYFAEGETQANVIFQILNARVRICFLTWVRESDHSFYHASVRPLCLQSLLITGI